MTWFRDPYGHIIESRNKTHRLVYCSLCQKLASKSDCKKLRVSTKNGKLYEVKSYKYNKPTRTESLRRTDSKRIRDSERALPQMVRDVV